MSYKTREREVDFEVHFDAKVLDARLERPCAVRQLRLCLWHPGRAQRTCTAGVCRS